MRNRSWTWSVVACAFGLQLAFAPLAKADAAKALEMAMDYGYGFADIARKRQSNFNDWQDLCRMFMGSVETKVAKALALGKVEGIKKWNVKLTCNASGCSDAYPEVSDKFFIGFVLAWLIDDHNPMEEQRRFLGQLYENPKILEADKTDRYRNPVRAVANEVKFQLRSEGSYSWIHVVNGKIWDVFTQAAGQQSIFKNAGAAIYNNQEKANNANDYVPESESRDSAIGYMQRKIRSVAGSTYARSGCP